MVLCTLINYSGPYFVSISLRDAEELFLTVWGSGGLCHHEGQNYKSVKRLWLCQIQRPQLCADGAGDKATQSRRKKREYFKSKEQIRQLNRLPFVPANVEKPYLQVCVFRARWRRC